MCFSLTPRTSRLKPGNVISDIFLNVSGLIGAVVLIGGEPSLCGRSTSLLWLDEPWVSTRPDPGAAWGLGLPLQATARDRAKTRRYVRTVTDRSSQSDRI